MVSNRRLLILSCSQRKRSDSNLLPAIERYDGPTFWVLRRFMREQPEGAGQLDIFVLSSAYGLIPVKRPIAEYDQVMTPQRATELHDEVLAAFASLICAGYTEFCLALGKNYLKVLEGWSALAPPGIPVTIADGSQGIRLAQLKRWLWRSIADSPGSKQREARPRGMARIRGVELQLTPAQVLERTRAVLVENGAGANRFREWYVDVDGRRVAPKWLIGVLTGLPVSAFTTGEARRVLERLGVQVRRIMETNQ